MESCVKITECISSEECIIRKVVLKLWNAYDVLILLEGDLS